MQDGPEMFKQAVYEDVSFTLSKLGRSVSRNFLSGLRRARRVGAGWHGIGVEQTRREGKRSAAGLLWMFHQHGKKLVLKIRCKDT